VTVTNPTVAGYVTVWPAGQPIPTASNLNFVPGQTVPNMVVVPLGANGQVSIFVNGGTADVIVDVLGWFPTGMAFSGLTPARLMDTRLAPAYPIGPTRSALVTRPKLEQASGFDRIAVWVCDMPGTSVPKLHDPVEPAAVAAWAQANVAPYFAQVSNGRYVPRFFPLGHIAVSADDSTQCLDKAIAATSAPFTNVLATDNTVVGGGFGGPGLITSSDSRIFDIFTDPPSVTGRGMWVGGGSTTTGADAYPSPAVVAHEIGHSLHWPHSFTGLSPDEYDNPTDLMSGDPDDESCTRSVSGGTEFWPCVPQNTVAFNRFAAGWIDDSKVAVQTGGSQTVTLDAPNGPGLQMLAAPAPGNGAVMLTLEARPKVGNDRFFTVEGVAAYIIDQRASACTANIGGACVSTDRRQRQAVLVANSYNHFVTVGSTATFNGVTVTVTGRSGNAFTVQVSGTFTAP
jgi:hypothetical protein